MPELARAMRIPKGVAVKLNKVVYGLVEAAIEWYPTVSEVMAEQGWTRIRMDPCVWVFYGDYHGKSNEHSLEVLAPHRSGQQVGK